MKHCVVVLTKRAQRDADRAPLQIKEALFEWARALEEAGLAEARKIRGYHDELLHGDRRGQRSVRLSRQWRAIYTQSERGELIVVSVEEVTPHAY